MTIKEIETITGLPRASVRFYEAQGLIHPLSLIHISSIILIQLYLHFCGLGFRNSRMVERHRLCFFTADVSCLLRYAVVFPFHFEYRSAGCIYHAVILRTTHPKLYLILNAAIILVPLQLKLCDLRCRHPRMLEGSCLSFVAANISGRSYLCAFRSRGR